MRVQPRIVEKVVDAKGNTIYVPPQAAPVRVISEKTAAVLNEILKAVVARGTGVHAALAEHVVAGKTGTAQKAVRGGYSPDKFVASFGGYVPADRPRLAILVVIDEPKGARVRRHRGRARLQRDRRIDAALPQRRAVRSRADDRPRRADAGDVFAKAMRRPRDRKSLTCEASTRARRWRAPRRPASASAPSGSGVVQTQQPLPGEALPNDHQVVLTLAEGAR